MWKSNVKNIFLTHIGLPELSQTGEFPQIAQSLTMSAHSRQLERQNIIDRRHTWQQCSVTISEDILTTKYDFNLREISPLSIDNELDNNTNILAGDYRAAHAPIGPHSHQVGTRNTQWHEIKGETVETLRVPTSPQGEHSLAESRHDHWCRLPDVYMGAKNSTGFPNTSWKNQTR